MAFQFIHLEAYSRKPDKGGRCVTWILDEADRERHACVHVSNPEPPAVIFGCSIPELRAAHDQAVADARTVNKDGKQRAVRIDQKTLLTVVASHPYTVAECRADAAKMTEYEAWERDTVQWLRDQYGDDLKTVVRHCDESHMHIHAYVLPGHLRALDLHRGVNAKRRQKAAAIEQGEDAKSANKMGDVAYKESMRAWQDSYYDRVAVYHGLARLGPKLRRLSREEWQREKAAAQALKKAVERAAIIQQQGNAYIRDVKKEVAELAAMSNAKSDVAAAHMKKASAAIEQAGKVTAKANLLNERVQKTHADAKQQAKTIIRDAQRESDRLVESADAEVRKVRSIANWIRSFWDSLRSSSIRKSLLNEVQPIIDRERKHVADVENQLQNEIRRRMSVETRLSNTNHSMQAVISERNQLRRQRDRQPNPEQQSFEPNSPKIR